MTGTDFHLFLGWKEFLFLSFFDVSIKKKSLHAILGLIFCHTARIHQKVIHQTIIRSHLNSKKERKVKSYESVGTRYRRLETTHLSN